MIKPQVLTSDLDRLVKKTMDDWKVPGLSIAVVDEDGIAARGYGVAAVSSGEKVTPSTLFDCASTSKSFTAAALSMLVDDETQPEVQWGTPVSRLMPDDFVLADRYATENITIEDILSHRSGMPSHDESYMGVDAKNPDTPQSITRNLRNLPLSQPLRTTYQYCNMMYVAAGHLVEVLTGMSLGEYLNQRIWEPLNMRNTYLGIDRVAAHDTSHLATGHRWDEKNQKHVELPWFREPEGQGAGSIVSSVLDFAQWIRAMIEREGPISLAGHDELVKPRIIEGSERITYHSDACYALGWEVENYRGERVIRHGGCVRGFGGLMLYLPERQWGFVVFGNGEDANDAAWKIGWHLVDEFLGVPETERFDWDGHLRKELEEALEVKSKEELYPDITGPPIPLAAPLELYQGSYTNPGYHTLTVELKDGKLQVDASDRSFGFTLFLEHVSGDLFVAEMVDTYSFDRTTMKAKFQLDMSGKVQHLGVAFVEEMESLIWFEREQ